MSIRGRVLLSLPVLFLGLGIGIALRTQADSSMSGQGWLWGSSENPDRGVQGVVSGNETGIGWISMNNVDESGAAVQGGTVPYGVSIPSSDGGLTGFAWVGYGQVAGDGDWLDFNPSGDALPVGQTNPCNGSAFGGVCRNGNNLKGWARLVGVKNSFVAGNSGGWEGWVSLSGSNYGVTINNDGTLAGYAWNGENNVAGVISGFGWIDFSKAKIVPPKTFKLCNSLNGIVPNSGSVTLQSGGSEAYRVYYDSTPDCATAAISGTNVTRDSTWSETNAPSDAGSWAASKPTGSTNTLTAVSVTSLPNRSESMSVTYLGNVLSFTLSVACAANPDPSTWTVDVGQDRTNTCTNKTVTAKDNCGGSRTLPGLKNCSKIGQWLEVAP